MELTEKLANPGQYTQLELERLAGLWVARRDEFATYSEWEAWPILYLTRDNNVLCANCATKSVTNPDEYDPVVTGDVYWKGDELECDDCGQFIESAYGPAEESTS